MFYIYFFRRNEKLLNEAFVDQFIYFINRIYYELSLITYN